MGIEREKPLVVLVYDQSILRLWMENALSRWFRVCAFSTSEDALAFIRHIPFLAVLVTDLDLGLSALGGCNIARDVHHRFPNCLIFVFSGTASTDHRLIILRGIDGVTLMSSPLDAFFIARRLRVALQERELAQ